MHDDNGDANRYPFQQEVLIWVHAQLVAHCDFLCQSLKLSLEERMYLNINMHEPSTSGPHLPKNKAGL